MFEKDLSDFSDEEFEAEQERRADLKKIKKRADKQKRISKFMEGKQLYEVMVGFRAYVVAKSEKKAQSAVLDQYKELGTLAIAEKDPVVLGAKELKDTKSIDADDLECYFIGDTSYTIEDIAECLKK